LKPIFVSFFTENYREEADGLIGTLKQFNLEYEIRHIEDRGSWVENCAQKPRFISDTMLWHPDRPVVWVDADARIRREPKLFDELDCDVAFHLRHEVELLSGTLYFGTSKRALQLVEDWQRRCVENPDKLDQVMLHDAVKDCVQDREVKYIARPQIDRSGNIIRWGGSGLRVQHLPANYVRIFDAADLGPIEESVILHTQASRRLRNDLHPAPHI
jgi:hypothetical protein